MLGLEPRGARGLLFSHLRERESRAYGNYVEDGVRRVRGHAQPVKPLPGTNANVGGIGVRALLGQLTPSPFLTLMLLVCKTLGGRLGGKYCGRLHMCEKAGYRSQSSMMT